MYRAVSSIIIRRLPLKQINSIQTKSNNNIRNPSRNPNKTLYLLVKKPRKHHSWQFPQGGQDPGETALEAALRELKEECGASLKVHIFEHAPIGTYQYEFPPTFNRWDNAIGAKVRQY
ncbi:uncharacterized protein BX663DRAFT_443289 [Cokeromyces recurvatus]|uniref:uncharacterized protein n=1 Tax=Cokeromyces recurvatus TaxID=90255 RepID=UPI00221F330F|nr:uncharacterized protein BX663DRAFT_443289 [Cokeromyces recurvatus]KAI7898363.1 hypothetical protein BX663DRAFT_443289 [Cokeromyces recurvatus]